MQGLVNRQSNANTSWETLFITDATGAIVASSAPPSADASVGGEPYFARARATLQPAVTNRIASPLTGRPAVLLSQPIVRDGQFGGIVAATILSGELDDLLAPLQISVDVISLWGSDGVLITTTAPSAMAGGVRPPHGEGAALPSTPGSAVVRDTAGKSWLVGYAPVSATPWTVVTSTPVAEALAPLFRDTLLFIVASALVITFAIAWARYAAGLFAEQVTALADRAREIGAGAFTPHVAPGLGGEMADLAQSLEGMAASLAVMDRMKSDLLGLVSHELRTPLTSIHASLDLLQSGLVTPDQPQYREVVDIAVRQTHRLQDMIDNLLNVARLQYGRLIVALQPAALRPLVDTAVEQHIEAAHARGLALTVDVPPDLRVLVDPARVTLALSNLLDNAVRFTEAGGIAVSARAEARFAILAVADTGVGIAEERIAGLFDPLSREGPLLTRRGDGAGLGLPVVKAVVEAHGGTVTVESTPGQGTTVAITLPLAP
jgi:signal transduction histidine kinase